MVCVCVNISWLNSQHKYNMSASLGHCPFAFVYRRSLPVRPHTHTHTSTQTHTQNTRYLRVPDDCACVLGCAATGLVSLKSSAIQSRRIRNSIHTFICIVQTGRQRDERTDGETDGGDSATYRQTRSSLVNITERIASTTVSATSVCFIVSLSLFVALFVVYILCSVFLDQYILSIFFSFC